MSVKSFFRWSLPRPPKKGLEDHAVLIKDPAIEKWAKMRETSHLYFKVTPKTIAMGVFWGILVPGALYSLFKWDLHRQDREAGRPPRDMP